MIRARWFDLGRTDPLTFHSTYAGLAEAGVADGSPAIVWGRVAAHVCLGQSQGLCELAETLDVPVVRRPLGGGAVWVDDLQLSYALVVPLVHAPLRPADWYAWALAPAIATFRAFGLAAERRAEDLWLAGRKIAGSGAATIGRSAVVASSFLLRFPRERFARVVAAHSAGFRARLHEALDLAMTDWGAHAAIPAEEGVRTAFRQALEGVLGWRVEAGIVEREQAAAIAEWRDELAAPIERGSPRHGGAIKLNAALTLSAVDGVPVLSCREPDTESA
jgi:lipoate-protein ligase A